MTIMERKGDLSETGAVFEWLAAEDIGPEFIQHWCRLAENAMDPNIYMAPQIQIAAWAISDEQKSIRIAVLWRQQKAELLALGIFVECPPNLSFPFRHLRIYRYKHGFLNSLLATDLNSDDAEWYLQKLAIGPYSGVYIDEHPRDGRTSEIFLRAANKLNWQWHLESKYKRACLCIENARHKNALTRISKSKLKSCRRRWRQLEAMGSLNWRYIEGNAIGEVEINTFLELEAMGWKGERGSALASDDADERFFRETMKVLSAQSQVFLTELVLDEEVIASTVNFVAGDRASAFKIAWNPKFRKFSPGILTEFRFLEELDSLPLAFSEIESGAQPGSYIDELWPDRMTIVAGYFSLRTGPRIVKQTIEHVRALRRTVKNLANKQVRSLASR